MRKASIILFVAIIVAIIVSSGCILDKFHGEHKKVPFNVTLQSKSPKIEGTFNATGVFIFNTTKPVSRVVVSTPDPDVKIDYKIVSKTNNTIVLRVVFSSDKSISKEIPLTFDFVSDDNEMFSVSKSVSVSIVYPEFGVFYRYVRPIDFSFGAGKFTIVFKPKDKLKYSIEEVKVSGAPNWLEASTEVNGYTVDVNLMVTNDTLVPKFGSLRLIVTAKVSFEGVSKSYRIVVPISFSYNMPDNADDAVENYYYRYGSSFGGSVVATYDVVSEIANKLGRYNAKIVYLSDQRPEGGMDYTKSPEINLGTIISSEPLPFNAISLKRITAEAYNSNVGQFYVIATIPKMGKTFEFIVFKV